MAIPFSFSAQAVVERQSCSMPYAVVVLDDEKATGQGNAETVSSTKVNAASFELYVDNPCPIMIAVNKSDLPECADHKKVLQDIENAV